MYHHKHRRRARRIVRASGILACGLLSVGLIPQHAHDKAKLDIPRQYMPPVDIPDFAASPADGEDNAKGEQWYGLCVRYGAATVGDFYSAVLADERLQTVYAGFQWDSARLTHAAHDSLRWVMYQKSGDLYWTREPLIIRAGEPIITDSKTEVRGYCCNKLSTSPAYPIVAADEQPPSAYLNPPAPILLEPRGTAPAIVALPGRQYSSDFSDAWPPATVHPVPEPSTGILTGIGALALAIMRRLYKKTKEHAKP